MTLVEQEIERFTNLFPEKYKYDSGKILDLLRSCFGNAISAKELTPVALFQDENVSFPIIALSQYPSRSPQMPRIPDNRVYNDLEKSEIHICYGQSDMLYLTVPVENSIQGLTGSDQFILERPYYPVGAEEARENIITIIEKSDQGNSGVVELKKKQIIQNPIALVVFTDEPLQVSKKTVRKNKCRDDNNKSYRAALILSETETQ